MVERGGECSTGSLWHSDKNAEKRFNNGDQESTEVLSCVARQIRSCYSDKNKQHQIRKIQKNMNWIQPLLDKGNLKKNKAIGLQLYDHEHFLCQNAEIDEWIGLCKDMCFWNYKWLSLFSFRSDLWRKLLFQSITGEPLGQALWNLIGRFVFLLTSIVFRWLGQRSKWPCMFKHCERVGPKLKKHSVVGCDQ